MESDMVKSLGKEAYAAARNQTIQKLDPMIKAFVALANENSVNSPSQGKSSKPKAAISKSTKKK